MKSQRRRLACCVGLFLFSIYLLSYRGGFHSIDEVSMFAVTESLVKFGRLNTDQIVWTQWTTTQAEAQGFFGSDRRGHVYSKKGLALSLAQAPLYWLALHLPGLGLVQTVALLNGFITALTGSLIFMFLWRWQYPAPVAVGVSLIFGTATIAAVYAKYMFSEPLAGCLLLLSAYMLFAYHQEGGLRHVAIAGLAAGLAVLTRANNLFLLPIFGLYLLSVGQASCLSKDNRQDARPTIYKKFIEIAVFGLAVGYIGILLMLYNDARASDPFQTGYDLTLFSPNVLLGLYKLLFSPLRGLFIYSPIFLLSLPGWWHLRKTHPAEAWLFAGLVGSTLALFSAWSSGEGLSWGSRFLVPLTPFFALCLAPLVSKVYFAEYETAKAVSLLRYGIGVLYLISLIIQVLAVAINPWIFLNQLQTQFGGQFFLERTDALYDFRYSQIVGQIQAWAVQNSDVVWWQPWGFDGLAFGLSISLVILSGWLLWAEVSGRESKDTYSLLLTPYFLFPTLYFPLLIFLLTRYNTTDRQFGLPNDAYSLALNMAVSQTDTHAPILTVAPYHYHVPMNRLKIPVPLIGFAQQKTPLPTEALALLKDTTTSETVWLVTVGLPTASRDNGIEEWLTFNAYKSTETWVEDTRLIRYSTEEPTLSRLVNVNIGTEIRLLEVQWSPIRQPAQLLPVKFTWRTIHRPATDYHLFLQLLDSNGTLIAQHDSPPNGGYTPTSSWFPGEGVVSRHALQIPKNLLPGQYRLIVGLYNPAHGQRLAVGDSDKVEIGEVEIK